MSVTTFPMSEEEREDSAFRALQSLKKSCSFLDIIRADSKS